jgi:outer membrane protein OmpA-like peptidoglycan-associated protein
MKSKVLRGLIVLSLLVTLSGLTGCAKNQYFGVRNKALEAPKEFAETEAAIDKAEKSPGAQYAPDKIAKARELGQKAVKTYWGCRTKEAMGMLAEARGLAKQATLAKAPPKPTPAPKAAVARPKPKPVPAKVAPAPPKPKPVAVPPPKRIIIYQKPTFGFDSTELSSEAEAVLDEQAGVLEKDSKLKLIIAGYTDSIGPEEYNQGLSERRANAAREYLISKGVAGDRLKAMGYGETRPIASNDTKEGRAQNRRIELIPIWK